MSCWSILGINPTKNIEEIKYSYLKAKKLLNFADKNKELDKLDKAYNKALSLATTSINDLDVSLFKSSNFDVLSALINSSIDSSEINTVPKFILKVNEIYNDPSMRFKKETWIELLTSPILKDSKVNLSLENELISFISKHKFLPHNIYIILNSRFNWTNRKEELKANFSDDIIDTLINEIKNPLPLSYNYLSSINSEKIEDYLILREKAFLTFENSDYECDKDYLSQAYSIYDKDLDLLRLLGYYYLNKNNNLMALRYFKEAIHIDNNDMYSLSYLGHLLTESSQYNKAIYYLEKYIKNLRNNMDINAVIDLAYCYYHSYELQKSKDLFYLLSKLRPWDMSFKDMLNNLNTKIGKEIPSNSSLPIYKKYLNLYLNPFKDKLNEIYNDFSLRINEESWSELLSFPIACNDFLFYLLESYVIEFITTNKNIPKDIYILLDNHFNWKERFTELTSIYPDLNIDLLYNKLSLNEPLSYIHLTDLNKKIASQYVEYRELAYNLVNSNSKDTEVYLNKALNLYDGDFELYKLYGQYYCNNNLYDKAIKSYKTVLSLKNDDHYSCCSLALLLTKIENYKDALYYLEKSVNTPAGSILLSNEDFLTKYAISYYYTNNLISAKKYFKKLCKLNPSLHFPKIYLTNINDRLLGKKRDIIKIDAINDINYVNNHFVSTTRNKFNSMKNGIKTLVNSFANNNN